VPLRGDIGANLEADVSPLLGVGHRESERAEPFTLSLSPLTEQLIIDPDSEGHIARDGVSDAQISEHMASRDQVAQRNVSKENLERAFIGRMSPDAPLWATSDLYLALPHVNPRFGSALPPTEEPRTTHALHSALTDRNLGLTEMLRKEEAVRSVDEPTRRLRQLPANPLARPQALDEERRRPRMIAASDHGRCPSWFTARPWRLETHGRRKCR
jgi:hypothetical protein